MKIFVVTDGTTATIARLSDLPHVGDVFTLRMNSFPNAREEMYRTGYPTLILPERDSEYGTYFFGNDELAYSSLLVPTFASGDALQVIRQHIGPDVILTSVLMSALFNNGDHREVKMYYVVHLASAQAPIDYKTE